MTLTRHMLGIRNQEEPQQILMHIQRSNMLPKKDNILEKVYRTISTSSRMTLGSNLVFFKIART